METICIHSRYLTKAEKRLLLRKGFKLLEIYSIPSGLYEGDVLTFSVPDELKIFKTTTENTFLIFHHGKEVCQIYYPYMKTAGIIALNLRSNYWR